MLVKKYLINSILLMYLFPLAINADSNHLFRYGTGFQIADHTYIGGNLYYSPPYFHSSTHEVGLNVLWYLSGGFFISGNQSNVRMDEWNNLELIYRMNVSPVSIKIYFYTINSHRFNNVELLSNERLLRQVSISYLGSKREVELFISPKAHQQLFGISFNKILRNK